MQVTRTCVGRCLDVAEAVVPRERDPLRRRGRRALGVLRCCRARRCRGHREVGERRVLGQGKLDRHGYGERPERLGELRPAAPVDDQREPDLRRAAQPRDHDGVRRQPVVGGRASGHRRGERGRDVGGDLDWYDAASTPAGTAGQARRLGRQRRPVVGRLAAERVVSVEQFALPGREVGVLQGLFVTAGAACELRDDRGTEQLERACVGND
jgi:hypothetical protein